MRRETPVLAGIAVVVGGLTLVPIGYLLAHAFFADGTPTLAHFTEAYASYGLGSMAVNSVIFAVASTVGAVAIGTCLAFLIVRTDLPIRGVLFLAMLVPLLIPGILHTIAWILLAAPRSGWINKALEPVFGPELFNVFGMAGMIFVEAAHLAPLAFLLMAAAFRSVDPTLEEAALVAGARWPTVLRRVTIPRVRPALLASALILGVRGLESFEVPALIGIPGRTWVFSSRIWRSLSSLPAKWGEAAALAVSLLVLTSIGVFLHARLTKRGRAFQTVAGRSFRPRAVPLRRWRAPALALALAYILLAVVLPIGVLAYASAIPFYVPPSWDSMSRLTWDNYSDTLANVDNLRAFRHSIVLGAASATLVVVLGAVVAWIVVRSRARARWILDDVAFLPLAIPGLVLGTALLFVYLRAPIPVYGTLWLLLIAYVTRYMPYGVRYVSVSMFQLGVELEEAARTSGATWWQAFRRVVVPLIVPGMAAGWVYVFALSIRELSSSILLYAPGTEVLSIRIWALYHGGRLPELAALGMLVTAFVLVLGGISFRLGNRLGVQEP